MLNSVDKILLTRVIWKYISCSLKLFCLVDVGITVLRKMTLHKWFTLLVSQAMIHVQNVFRNKQNKIYQEWTKIRVKVRDRVRNTSWFRPQQVNFECSNLCLRGHPFHYKRKRDKDCLATLVWKSILCQEEKNTLQIKESNIWRTPEKNQFWWPCMMKLRSVGKVLNSFQEVQNN